MMVCQKGIFIIRGDHVVYQVENQHHYVNVVSNTIINYRIYFV